VQNGHDLVIVADPKRDAFRGPAAVQLVRKCPCSVWLINSDARRPYRRVVAAVDADPYDAERDVLNARILRTAASIARVERSELHIAHAWMAVGEGILRGRGGFMPEEVGKYVDSVLHERTEAIDSLMKRSNVRASKRRVHLAKGPAGRVIPAVVATKEADLLVMGTLKRRGLARWFLANTAEEVLRRVSCDVLIIKPGRFAIQERLEPSPIRPAAPGSPPVTERKEIFDEKYGFG
jgi:nucleotide-binding universal stress UspA family protein